MKISDCIIQLRKANNLPQDELAIELKVSYEEVTKWENDISYPSTNIIVKINQKYNVSLNDHIVKNDLAYKSTSGTVLLIVGTFLFILFSIFDLAYKSSLEPRQSLAGIAALITSTIMLPITILNVFVPKQPIKYNDYGLFLYFFGKKEIFIPYENIVNTKAKVAKARNASWYKFGSIVIETKYNVYTMRNISKVAEVNGRIIYLKKKFTCKQK